MTVTDVRVRKIPSDGKLKAVASITLDDVFVVHDIKIIEGDNGLFIAMPSRKSGENEFRDVAHPLNTETRDYIQEIILKEYCEYVGIDRESVS
ncbi:MAG: septation regulator SpoVG [Lachnospiraceae bacterium]|nr:septation regulator SpoVG [Lachnospiraceae bacterium]